MPRVVIYDEFGGPEVLQIVEEPVVEPAADEVRVRLEAFAVNPLDQMMRAGLSPRPVPLPHARLGVEGTGVIDALGSAVAGFAVGDRVLLVAVPDASVNGAYADFTTLPASQVIPRPQGLDVPEAAAIWVGFSTAYGALIEKAQMRPGDRVLITAPSGAVGRSAIQIARQIGAVPIALTRSVAKRSDLLSAGAAAVVVTDAEDVVRSVRDVTEGVGVDIVLDLVTGPGQQDLLRATRPGGVLVAAGFLDPQPTPEVTGDSVAIIGYRSFEHTLDPVVVRRMAAFLEAGIRSGVVRPIVDSVVELDGIVEAHRRLEHGAYTGKMIVTLG